jgi:hypothetical protein
MAERAISAGAQHVSFEYLKIGTEGREHQCRVLSEVLGMNVWGAMEARGVRRLGRDYTIVPTGKHHFLSEARAHCHSLGAKFGASDTEFIHLSDGSGCCNGSSLFLNDANQFRANYVGVLSDRKIGSRVFFADVLAMWHPEKSVHSYLTTDSRGRDKSGKYNSWMSLIAHRWNGGRGPYSPLFFHGVSWTGEYDDHGFKVYRIDNGL